MSDYKLGDNVKVKETKGRASFEGIIIDSFVSGKGTNQYTVEDSDGETWHRVAGEFYGLV